MQQNTIILAKHGWNEKFGKQRTGLSSISATLPPTCISFHHRHHDIPLCDGSSYMAPNIDVDTWEYHCSRGIQVSDTGGTAACFAYERHRAPRGAAFWAAVGSLHGNWHDEQPGSHLHTKRTILTVRLSVSGRDPWPHDHQSLRFVPLQLVWSLSKLLSLGFPRKSPSWYFGRNTMTKGWLTRRKICWCWRSLESPTLPAEVREGHSWDISL